ncbi:MAG: DNA repair protein RecO [Magnetospiraceae bacterium]
MIEWRDEGYILEMRRHGEGDAILQVLTAAHGRHAGLVKGGAGRRSKGNYQPGNRVQVQWRARLADHLGTYRCDVIQNNGGQIIGDAAALNALSAACAVCLTALPEREDHASVFNSFEVLVEMLGEKDWPSLYIRWELGLLRELGFGLDLSQCAATGTNDQLAYVSPKSGRAVSLSAGAPYKGVLLDLPAFLVRPDHAPSPEETRQGLALTGFFLDKCVYHPQGAAQPPARRRFIDWLARL